MRTGGSRYGAGRPGWRRKCESRLRLDLRQLRRRGHTTAGQDFGWAWFREGEEFASIGVRTFADSMLLNYTWTPNGDPIAISCSVSLTQTPCTYGGWWTYFVCPECGRM